MYTVTLLCAPGSKLDAALLEKLHKHWSGGELDWLAEDEAVQFSITSQPKDFKRQWTECMVSGIDLVVHKGPPRLHKLLLADMDSTMIEQECIDELASAAGVGREVRAITAKAMNGDIEFEDAVRARVRQMAGIDAEIIQEVIKERITFASGAQELVSTMRTRGSHTVLISGGFRVFSSFVAESLGFHEHFANELNVKAGWIQGTVSEPILGRDAKLEALQQISDRLGCTADEVVAVGDGANDLAMLGAAGLGVALHAKPAVQEAVRVRINHGDLTALLYIQGIPKETFVQ